MAPIQKKPPERTRIFPRVFNADTNNHFYVAAGLQSILLYHVSYLDNEARKFGLLDCKLYIGSESTVDSNRQIYDGVFTLCWEISGSYAVISVDIINLAAS